MILRLLINKETERILYAEAGKDFVDLLFSFLTLPTGSVIKLLSASGRPKKVACITSLYNSVEKLQTVFMKADKSHLLEPKVISPHYSDVLRIKCSPDPTVYYACSSLNTRPLNPRPFGDSGYYNGIHNISTQNGGLCACGQSICSQVQMQNSTQEDTNQVRGLGRNTFGKETGKSGSGSSGGGYVKETVTFIITDELEISPSSTITSINLLNKLNVKDLTNLEERTARVGATEALELLGASLVSTTALNDVFGPPARSNPRPQQFEEEDEEEKKDHSCDEKDSCDKKDEEDTQPQQKIEQLLKEVEEWNQKHIDRSKRRLSPHPHRAHH